MSPELKITLIILAVFSFLALVISLSVLFMIAPGKRRKEMEKYKKVKFAHRGLHGYTVAENSLTAFAEAKKMGYGIELDVQLSRDGQLVVFHDSTLNRVCGIDGRVKDFTVEELRKMSLSGTSDTIPTFQEVLSLINESVPLLIEIKMDAGESGIAERFIEEIKDYHGEYIVESFNPLALRTVKAARPDILRGILSMDYMTEEKYRGKITYRLLKNLLLNFLMRPDFIAYRHTDYKNTGLRFVRRTFGTPLFAWTIKSAQAEAEAISHGFDSVIFEDYYPTKS